MRKYYTLALLTSVIFSANASRLSPEQALERVGMVPGVSTTIKTLSKSGLSPVMSISPTSERGSAAVYVFDNYGSGFLVVSADDVAVPLLGYSDSGVFDPSNVPPQLKWWLDTYANEIQYASTHPEATSTVSRPEREAISPLLTTLWNQDAPYNNDCPMYEGSRSVTGCVATAMAQAMKYHNWPEKGKGENSYTCNGQTISLNFADITFDWTHMTDTYGSSSTAAENAAVAELMYAAGVSVDMDYTSSESGAASINIAPALYNYFDYSAAMVQPQRAFYGLIDWENIVYDQLQKGMPVLYGGQSNEGGHQFVCDGYSTDGYFHFNWGWAGESDGYYLLSALDPLTQGIGGSTTGFNYDQSIVINMAPSTKSIDVVPLVYCYGSFETETTDTSLGSEVAFLSSEAFYNFGCSSATGSMGIKITGTDGASQYAAGSQQTLAVASGIEGYYVTLPQSLSDGSYTVTPAFEYGNGLWTDVLAPLSGVQSLTMTVEQGQVSFVNGTAPSVEITDFTLASPIYLGTNFKATFTISNNGSNEYYGQLMMGLMNSSTGQLASETSAAQAVDVDANDSASVTFIGSFASEISTESGTTESVEAGNYALVVFDMLTESVVYQYPQTVAVESAPTSTTLSVSNFALDTTTGTNVATDASAVRFKGTVECTDGYYANQLKVAIFPMGATSTSLEGSTDYLFLAEGNSTEFTATVNLEGNPNGQYYAVVYNANNQSLSDALEFTLSADSDGVSDPTVTTSDEPIQYYNLSGIRVDGSSLTPGIYIRRQGPVVTKTLTL